MIGNGWKRLACVAACGSTVALAACGGGSDASDTTNVAAGDVARTDTAAGATAAATTPAAAGAGTAGAMSITGGDPEVLQFLATVDVSEIEAGRLGQRQARNAQVKSFARTLVTEHQQSLRHDRDLAKSANITLDSAAMAGVSGTKTGTGATAAATTPSPAPSTTSGVVSQLTSMHQQAMQRLQSLKGADFDTAFMNAQVTAHQQVLDVLQRAQGQPQNANIQQHLQMVTQGVQKHLDRARELQQSLMSGGTGAAGDTGAKAKSDTGRRG
jgi:predicted outer membrane protein